MDVNGLYPNIPHGEGLASLRRFLEARDSKQVSRITYLNLMKRLSNRNVEPQ